LDSPAASPYALSFYTLPQHWEFMDYANNPKKTTPAANMVPAGDFEIVPGRVQETWVVQESTLDDVDLSINRVTETQVPPPVKVTKPGDPPPKPDEKPAPPTKLGAVQGKQFLLLEVKLKSKEQKLPKALERTYLAVSSPAVQLTPGSLVRISGYMAIPQQIQASVDGALLFDSAGGEPLAIRQTTATGWKKFTLYRQVPPSGSISVTVALTGIGRAAFDDLRIEPLIPGDSGAKATGP